MLPEIVGALRIKRLVQAKCQELGRPGIVKRMLPKLEVLLRNAWTGIGKGFSLAFYSSFSFTALWARFGAAADSVLISSENAPRGIVVELPENERTALTSRIAPFVAGLEQFRLETLGAVDRRARLVVPLAGGGTFLILLLTGQGVGGAVIFGFIAAVSGWFLAMGNRSGVYQAAVKRRFAQTITAHLSGFEHIVEPETDLAQLRTWHLFPDLQSARTTDQIKGQRDGRSLLLSERSIAYAPSPRRNMRDHTLSFTVIEVACAKLGEANIVLTPKDAPHRLLESQRKTSNRKESVTGDTRFDMAYLKRIGTPYAERILTDKLRAAILALGKIGPAGSPYLVFMRGSLVVLFPTSHADLAFHVPPYWVPIDADLLLAQFASDLALKNRLINAVLELPLP